MNIFNKDTSETAMCIIRTYLESGVQPIMFEMFDDCHIELAQVEEEDQYKSGWMFATSCKCKKSCSFWELNDLVEDYGITIELKKGQDPKLMPIEEGVISLCA